jgi:hypothetical protein
MVKAVIVDVPVRKDKFGTMKHYDRDLLVLYKAEIYNDDLLEQEVECLHRILLKVEGSDVFCGAHELVTRNKISSRARSILKAVRHLRLRPFHFLINRN